MSAHSAIQAKYVQSQGAQATAICLTFARKSTEREGRASNSTLFLLCFVFSQRVCNISQIFQGDFADCQRQQFV